MIRHVDPNSDRTCIGVGQRDGHDYEHVYPLMLGVPDVLHHVWMRGVAHDWTVI